MLGSSRSGEAQAAWQVGAAGQGKQTGLGRRWQPPWWRQHPAPLPATRPVPQPMQLAQACQTTKKPREHPTSADESIEMYNQSTTRAHLRQPGAAGGRGSTQIAMQLLHQRCQQLFGGELQRYGERKRGSELHTHKDRERERE